MTQLSVPGTLAPYQGLWPFRSAAEVAAWEQTYRSTGSDAWHLQADTTALDFTTKFLGFADIDSVLSTVANGAGTHVTVGFHPTSSQSSPSAVIHLVQWGSGPTAPWEVVDTDDTTFAMTTPAYGSVASSPLSVGGTVTGVDESIRVTVRQPSSTSPLGTFCCIPAGGTASPWSASVSYAGAIDPVLTVVAVTGGHVQADERFTITAVRTSASPTSTTSSVSQPERSTTTAPSIASSRTVVYTVIASCSSSCWVETVNYTDTNGAVVHQSTVSLPATYSVSRNTGDSYMINATLGFAGTPPTAPSLTCTVTISGVEVASHTVEGAGPVTCQGTVS